MFWDTIIRHDVFNLMKNAFKGKGNPQFLSILVLLHCYGGNKLIKRVKIASTDELDRQLHKYDKDLPAHEFKSHECLALKLKIESRFNDSGMLNFGDTF